MAKQNLYKLIIVVAIVFCLITLMDLNVIIANAAEISVNAENGSPVAKVGNVEYSTIDEAIANWTAGKTLTLLENDHNHCICGATHASVGDHTDETSVVWTEWDGGSSIVTDEAYTCLTCFTV